MNGIVLNWEKDLIDSDVDSELSKKLAESGFSLDDTVDEMKSLMDKAKLSNSAEALKLRLELIKHVQALHWSRASKQNVNIGIFMHPRVWEKLNY